MKLPPGYQWDPHFELGHESSALMERLWPNFLTEDSDHPEPGLKVTLTREELKRRFPAWGIRRTLDGALAAFAHAAHVNVDLEAATLPQAGWTFAVSSALSSHQTNSLCLLAANVAPESRGLGLAQTLIERALETTREYQYKAMIAPVRPTHKHKDPFSTLETYLDTAPPDPWLKLHFDCGAKRLNICTESVKIRASVERWRRWTGLPLETSGHYALPSGLTPLQLNLERDEGLYLEPNIWVHYQIAKGT